MKDFDARDQFRYVLEWRREIFGGEPSIEQTLAFIAGFDVAQGFAPLRGFSDWLVVKLGGRCHNIHWFGLVRSLALGVAPWDPSPKLSPTLEAAAAVRIFELVIEFLDDVNGIDGRRRMYAAYERLLGSEDPT